MLALDQTSEKKAAASGASCAASFRLDGYFCDHAVLERNAVIPVSGYAAPESVVEVCLCGVCARSVAAPDGRFTVNLPPMSACRDQQLRVVNGSREIVCDDISIGEVYLVAGQSNIQFPLRDSVPGSESASDEEFSALRYFKIPPNRYYGRQRSLHGAWQKISRADAAAISGVAFFFGNAVAKDSGIPVGLIDASLGGINLESWVSRETLLAHPAYRQELLDYERSVSTGWTDTDGKLPDLNDKIFTGLKNLFPAVPDDRKFEAGYAGENFDDDAWPTMLLPDSWTEAGHNHAGIFWFRRTVELPSAWGKQELELHLGAIDKSDKVYFNGKFIGGMGDPCVWDYWATRRVYTIPSELVKAGRNQIAIQAGSMASICTDGGVVGPASEMYLVCKAMPNAARVMLAGEWRYQQTMDAGTIGMTFMRTLGAGAPQSLHMLYDNMILPLAGIPMRGVLWYQGEANAICTAAHYETLLRAMVADWRRTLGNLELEFFIVQLPDYHNPHYFAPFNQWTLIREAQANVACADAYSDCIVTLGWGDVVELHPCNKKAVGEAAARCAIARLRGETPPTGPRFDKMVQKEAALELTFSGGKLPGVGTEIAGFAIANDAGKAFPAQAEVIGEKTIRVFSAEVADPRRVWYAWAGNPRKFELQSVDGVKASPFRAVLNGDPREATATNLIP